MPVILPANAIVGVMVKCAAVLTVLSAMGQTAKFLLNDPRLGSVARFLDLNRERNLPTWYQGITLVLCTVLLGGIAGARRSTSGTGAGSR